MSKKFARVSDRKTRLFLTILAVPITCLLCWELGIDFYVIGLGGDGGAPYDESGQVQINQTSRTDADFVEASISFLQEMDWWWQGTPYLVWISRNLKCSQVHAQSTHEAYLEFGSAERTTLLVEAVNSASIEFINEGRTLQYALYEYDRSRVIPHEELDLSRINVDSIQALDLAEAHGGEAFRVGIEDMCEIHITLARHLTDWRVIYRSKENTLSFDINPVTGEVR